ncbi:MAG: hypothetical protein CL685_03940 [Candidatus Magasanikbacteria bacterium]|nr:hypothetical protein [Candidatus Magasanikbacteria bacterium]
MEADGGVNETIVLHSNQGTGADSITLLSDAGGITLDAAVGGVAVTGDVSLTDGALVYADANDEGTCADTVATIDLSLGNYHELDMDNTENCTITFSNGSAGEIHLLELEWSGTHDFILNDVTAQEVTIKELCDASGKVPDDNGDLATLMIRARSASQIQIISCATMKTTD